MMNEQEQIEKVRYDGYYIQYIDNPTEAVQLAAVKENAYAIEFIKKPTEAVQLAAVNQTGYAIRYIKDPSEVVQIAAIKNSPHAIFYINEPTLQMIKLHLLYHRYDANELSNYKFGYLTQEEQKEINDLIKVNKVMG